MAIKNRSIVAFKDTKDPIILNFLNQSDTNIFRVSDVFYLNGKKKVRFQGEHTCFPLSSVKESEPLGKLFAGSKVKIKESCKCDTVDYNRVYEINGVDHNDVYIPALSCWIKTSDTILVEI